MKSVVHKEAPRKVSCLTSEVQLDCSIARRCIQEVVLQASGFTQGKPQLNVQASITPSALELAIVCTHANCLAPRFAGVTERHLQCIAC